MKRVAARVFVASLAVWMGGCVLFARPLRAPGGDDAVVMVLSNRLEGPLRRIARHAYLAVREPGAAEWRIWECCSPGSHTKKDPFEPSFGDEVVLHDVFRGAAAEKMIACIPGATEAYGRPRYLPWPGPNSNTYVDYVMRECDIPADLPAASVGKDWRGLGGMSWTSGGTGFQIETPILGLRVGLKEGIELHVFALAIGVDLWPPAIIFPVGAGRIGFADR